MGFPAVLIYFSTRTFHLSISLPAINGGKAAVIDCRMEQSIGKLILCSRETSGDYLISFLNPISGCFEMITITFPTQDHFKSSTISSNSYFEKKHPLKWKKVHIRTTGYL
eukprot:TRINITY_DN25863_c0_g2_i1.p1 TRINITY_DN25863_c0_g2~~TRINITY_DN25863_c0_g2_i1.p1  ORF type:complete len:110 (-),score=10.37 TRINITY_DN25863_c0_g2_i1:44-373(-)